MKLFITYLFIVLCGCIFSQAPTCPNNQVYIHNGSSINFQTVPLPGAAGVVMSNLPGGSGGLAVGPAFGFPAPNPTYWTTSGGTYWYYNGTNWTNTTHSTGNGAAVNIGGGGGFLYNLVGGTGQIYVYNGTGPGTLLTTLVGFSGGGPYDVVCDAAGNFFILKNTAVQSLTMYGPNGAIKCSWNLANNPTSSAGGGFAIVGNKVYYHNGTFYAGNIIPGNSTITFTAQAGITSPSDFASCPIPIPTGTVLAPNGGILNCNITQLNLVAQVIPAGIGYPATAVQSSSLATCNYTWSGPGIIAGQFTPTITVNQPGVYSFTTCAGSTCPNYTISNSFTVVGQAALITPSITSSGSITCTNSNVQLAVTPNASTNTIVWTGPGIVSGQGTPSITVNAAGLYSVSLTNTVNACAGSATINVISSQPPMSLTMTSSGSITCTNPTVQLAVAPNASTNTIVWSGPGIVSGQGTPSVTVNSAGLYSISVSNTVNPCSGTNTINVINTQAPLSLTVIPINPTKCSADAAIGYTLSGATSFTWNPASTVSQITSTTYSVNPPATTSYTIFGSTGVCTGSAVTTVSVIPSPTVSIALSSNTICAQNTNGSPFTFSATSSGATNYTWTLSAPLTTNSSLNSSILGPITNAVVSGIPQNGTITLTGVNGICSNTTQTNVLIIPNPTITVSPSSTSICQGSSFTFTASGASSYSWNPPTGLNTTVGSVVSANPVNSTTYNINGSAAGCFAATQSASLTILPTPTIGINPISPTVCAGSSINLTANGATNFTWSPAGSLSSANGAMVSASPAADQTYTVLGSLNTCTSNGFITVTVIPVPNLFASASQGTICAGNTTNLLVNGATSFSWSPSNGLSNTTGNFVVATPVNTTTYTIMGNNGLCTGTVSLPVYVIPLPNASISALTTFICEGSSTTLFASGAQNFNWSPAGSLSATSGSMVIATPSVSTNYNVVAYNSLGSVSCSQLLSYSIVVVPNAAANLPANKIICAGEKASITVSGGNTYTWTPSTGLNITYGNSVVSSPSASIVYSVNSSFNGNCATTNTILVKVNPLPLVNAGRDTIFNLEEYKLVKGTGTGTLTWVDGSNIWCSVCPETQIQPLNNSCYTLLAENEFGCKNTDLVCVEITTEFGVYIPNAITPNDDGLNDVFYVYGFNIYEVQVIIFNRWGDEIFNSGDRAVGWPGTFKGVDCPNDVYVYKVKYKGLDGKIYHKTGHVTLNR